MERLIVDTGVLIGVERSQGRLALPVADEDDVAIAALTAAELLVGVQLADGARRDARAKFVERALETLPAIEYGTAVAREHAILLAHAKTAGRPCGAHDLIIAATARAEGRVLLTTDRRAFAELPGLAVRIAD